MSLHDTLGVGIHPDVDEATYHADEAVSQSQLKQVLESPARFAHSLTVPKETKDAWDWGHAVHAEVLGTGQEVVALDFDSFRTKAAQEAKAEAHDAGKTPLLAKDVQPIKDAAAAVLAHPAARAILETDGTPEVSALWVDNDTGQRVRGRFDWLTEMADGTPFIGDLKSARDASHDAFARDVWNLRYLLQRVCYLAAHETIVGVRPEWGWIVVENTAPYRVNVFRADDLMDTAGHRDYRDALAIYAECMSTGHWPPGPGFFADIETLYSPRWAS